MRIFENQNYPIDGITGIIMTHNWDEDGNVIQIALYTNKEEVYPIEHNQKEKELLNYIGSKVSVKGEMLRKNNGEQSIIVKNFLEKF